MKCRKCLKEIQEDMIYKKYINHCYCKSCKSKEDNEYRIRNKESIAKQRANKWRTNPEVRRRNTYYKEKRRTGMDATNYVKDKCCEVCNMTNQEHKTKWNERLHIHHPHNDGRHNIRKGNEPIHNSIMVLCRSCHVTKDNKENKNYDYIRGNKYRTNYVINNTRVT